MLQFISKCCWYVPTLLEVKVNITVDHLNDKQRKLSFGSDLCFVSSTQERSVPPCRGCLSMVTVAWRSSS